MSKAGNRGLFEQQNDERHDEIVFDLATRADELIAIVGGGTNTRDFKFDAGDWNHDLGLERNAIIGTVTTTVHDQWHEIEKPVRGARNFLIGFADLFIVWEEERRADVNPHLADKLKFWLDYMGYDRPNQTQRSRRAMLVEVKTGKLRPGETLRQLKAYRPELRPVPHRMIVAVDTPPPTSVVLGLQHEGVHTIVVEPGGHITPLEFEPFNGAS